VTDVSRCALAMAEHVVVGSRPGYSCAGVRTPAQRWRCCQHVRGNGGTGVLVFRRRGMSAAGGCRFGAIVPKSCPRSASTQRSTLSRARPVRSGGATQRVALSEPRKRRASERPRIGSCVELAGRP
jgi:hypothetical protein